MDYYFENHSYVKQIIFHSWLFMTLRNNYIKRYLCLLKDKFPKKNLMSAFE